MYWKHEATETRKPGQFYTLSPTGLAQLEMMSSGRDYHEYLCAHGQPYLKFGNHVRYYSIINSSNEL